MRFENIALLTMFLVSFFVTGILAGVSYYGLKTMETELRGVDFVIPGAQNSSNPDTRNVTTFQDVLDITIFPLFDFVDKLPMFSYFMLFAYIIGLAVTAYVSTKNPVFFVVHFLYTLILTYFAMILANAYAEILANPIMDSIMVNFPVYNLLMMYLPQVFFITSLLFGTISFITILKPSTAENPQGLNYGGDY